MGRRWFAKAAARHAHSRSDRCWAFVCGAAGTAVVLAAQYAWDSYQWGLVVRRVAAGLPGGHRDPTGPLSAGPLFAVEADRDCDWCDEPIIEGSYAGFVEGELMCEDCWGQLTGGDQQ
jgi:hypothetical protein